jgi:hypothetical protein
MSGPAWRRPPAKPNLIRTAPWCNGPMGHADADAAFATLADRFAAEPDVEPGTGFGSAPGLRAGGKVFVMLPHGELVVKLPAERCAAMVDAGAGRLFVVGRRTMREWVVVGGVDPEAWAALADEALAYVRG